MLLACAPADKLVSVSEPSTCVYEAVFFTPSACETETLQRKHEALQQAASAAGLPYDAGDGVRRILAR